MTNPTTETVRIVIPLQLRHKNGRPKIMPPADYATCEDHAQDPHILRAIGKAWAWRRRMEAGEFTTVRDLARAEKLADRFVSRRMRLAYLSPAVLRRLLLHCEAPAATITDLVAAASLPWTQQEAVVFGGDC